MQLKKLLKGLDIEEITGSSDVNIKGISSHSMEVKEGYMFVALRGNLRDGHSFIPEVVKKGSVVVVIEKRLDVPLNGITYVRVPDAKEALAKIADNFYGNPTLHMKMIGITGTNGKTTVSYLIEDILKMHGFKTGRIGTIDYSWGERSIPSSLTTPTPPALSELFSKMREDGTKAVVMEVSSHSLAQRRVDAIQFDSCIFTNISRDHLDYHSNLSNYISSKRRLTELLVSSSKKNKFLVINGDDKILKSFSLSSLPCIFYGLKQTNDVYASRVKSNWHGVKFHLNSPWYKGKVEVPLFGDFNIYNVLASISWAGAAELDINKVIENLKKTKQVIGRFHVIKKNGVAAIVDYAHSPNALLQVIKTAQELVKGRLITVFGCGGERDKGKRPLMGRISSEESDYTIVTSDNPRSEDPLGIIEDIKKGLVGKRWCVEYDRRKAIKEGIKMLEKGDILLIAGKGHENYQILKDTVIPFNDIEVVKGIFNGLKNF
jgi:UDP-N-acetylmuramoyl-L-alanyl-D-glutamate--2,6-diaminopimelate ligase